MFPDIANVLCIREALWRHKALGSASIMVGAGFSRNADPVASTAPPMPGWSRMAVALCHRLYPMDDARQRSALHEASGTSGFLRLAQEYQAAFGASALNDRIRNLVPDMQYRPGDLHARLLRLPWADIFSTNWDTLLERTCADVFDRSYDIVRTVGEIPFTTRPRIVKLHGSFPGHEPFIFTEEEYRTYPVQYSPFVNLVQQSMMETIFCLVGFSGDDPNFLHWSGWVRDNLGAGAPKIYLVGWLELSVHRRRMLEARNVMPIDLSALPMADKLPTDLRHRYATEWFIAALELGKPHGGTRWPLPPSPRAPTPPHLGVIPASTEPSPQSEPFVPPLDKGVAERDQAFRAAIDAWAHNRRLYPGWLIAPDHVREALRHSLSAWIWEFSRLQALSALDRLKALSELAWRMDRALLPFPSEQEDAAYAALSTVDSAARAIDGVRLPETEEWSEILRGADTLALALSRNARKAANRARFDQALRFLIPQGDHDPEIRNAIAYEECLWNLAAGDLTSLLSGLDKWIPAFADTLWSLRKAGLLAEMHDDARACALLESTLVQIRRARRRDTDDLVALSMEGWALYLALAYSNRGLAQTPMLSKDMPQPFERWRALGIVDCDAFGDYRTLQQSLEANTPQQPEITKTRGFDLDHSGMTHHLIRQPSPTVVAAYQMVTLAEMTGIPPATNHVNLFAKGLTAAARILAISEPWLASQLAIRIQASDELLEHVFSRARVARLSESLVAMLRDTLSKRLNFALARLGVPGSHSHNVVDMVRSALEILSRIAVRLRPEQLRVLFEEAISYYRSPVFRRMSTFLGTPLAHLLARILESLPPADIVASLPMLFALPLPREIGMEADEHNWWDPASVLPDWFDGALEAGPRDPAWQGIVSHLLVAANGAIAANRIAAVYRLLKLFHWQILTKGETEMFAGALWAPEQRDGFGLPRQTNLRPWALLELPEQWPGQARDALLHFIAEQSRVQAGRILERLDEIGDSLRGFASHAVAIELSADVKTNLAILIGEWTVIQIEDRNELERRLNQRENQERAALHGVAAILPYINASDELLEKIWNKASAIDAERRAGAFALYSMLVRHFPARAQELLDRLRRALLSDQEDAVSVAVVGLYAWLNAQTLPGQEADAELDDLAREVGIGIAARRLVLLRPGLDFARWVFREGPERIRRLIVRDCDHGLTALLEEASYARPEQAFDVPAIRAACFRLASAMAAAGFAQERGVTGWLAIAKFDPLPEVRNAEARKQGEQSFY